MNMSLILNGYKWKVETPDELLTRSLDAAACIKKRENKLRKKHAIFTHKLQSALRSIVGFSNIYCEL
jgi:hypothetical protein